MSNAGQQLLSGALSGFATTLCLQPFDLLKTRIQQADGLQKKRITLVSRTTHTIIRSNGLVGLWRGTTASLIRNVPGIALYLTGVTQLRALMATSPYFVRVRNDSSATGSVLPTLTSQGNLVAGATTRVGVGLILNPFSVLKARFESDIYAYQNLTSAFVSIVRKGPSELLRGFLASSLRDAPYAGLFLVIYEGIKSEASMVLPSRTNTQSSILHGAAAASAGATATMLTHPFDVIKTKVQVRNEDRYRGFMKTVQTIWGQRGLRGFFDGASLRLTRKVFSAAIGWAVYEGLLIFIHQPIT